MDFTVHAQGYQSRSDVRLRPDGQEHVVELTPALVVEGTVVDAETEKPIPRFNIICGYPTGVDQHPQWIPFGRFRLDFSGGEFQHKLNEPVISGIPNPGYFFKFGAEGYASKISRLVAPDEGMVRFAVRLKPAGSRIVTVLLPDGQPAAGTDIALVTPGTRTRLTPVGFPRSPEQDQDALRRTDEAGRFSFPVDDAIERVIVAGPSGYAEMTSEALKAAEIIHLVPWGRVTGIYMRQGKPTANAWLVLEPIFYRGQMLSFQGFMDWTDDAGHFSFGHVAPGIHTLYLWIMTGTGPRMTLERRQLLRMVRVKAGKTTEVEFGRQGYSVAVRPNWPSGLAAPEKRRTTVLLADHGIMPPQEMQGDVDAMVAWAIEQDRQGTFRFPQYYEMIRQAENEYLAEDVQPREYVLQIKVWNDATQQLVAGAESPLTVPVDPPTGHIDLGEIVLQPLE